MTRTLGRLLTDARLHAALLAVAGVGMVLFAPDVADSHWKVRLASLAFGLNVFVGGLMLRPVLDRWARRPTVDR